jgi:hypothetical protein
MHSLVHPKRAGTGASPYYTKTPLTKAVLRDLQWWQTVLSTPGGRAARSERSATVLTTRRPPLLKRSCETFSGGRLACPHQAAAPLVLNVQPLLCQTGAMVLVLVLVGLSVGVGLSASVPILSRCGWASGPRLCMHLRRTGRSS